LTPDACTDPDKFEVKSTVAQGNSPDMAGEAGWRPDYRPDGFEPAPSAGRPQSGNFGMTGKIGQLIMSIHEVRSCKATAVIFYGVTTPGGKI